jgi:hypothetical protein
LWRALATYDAKDWDTLLGKDWKKRVGDIVRQGEQKSNEQRRRQ